MALSTRMRNKIWHECYDKAKGELSTREVGETGVAVIAYDAFAVDQRAKELMLERTGEQVKTFFD